MEKLIEKLEIYHFINYIIPGAVFISICNTVFGLACVEANVAVAILEYYFTGLVLSRIGSILIKPILKNTKIIKNTEYSNFIKASEKDSKVDVLQREANQYRTYIAMFITLLCIQIYYCIANREFSVFIFVFIAFAVLFVLSYRKQVNFVVGRVEERIKEINQKKVCEVVEKM